MIIPNDLSFFPFIALFFLILNSVTAIYRARSDYWTVTFVLLADVTLLLLLWCLSTLGKDAKIQSPSRRQRLKVWVWLLSTTLNFMFAYRSSMNLPISMSVAMGMVVVFSSLAIFFGLFIYGDSSTYGYWNGSDDSNGGGGDDDIKSINGSSARTVTKTERSF